MQICEKLNEFGKYVVPEFSKFFFVLSNNWARKNLNCGDKNSFQPKKLKNRFKIQNSKKFEKIDIDLKKRNVNLNINYLYEFGKFILCNSYHGGEQEYRITDGLGPKPKTERQKFRPFWFCFSEVLNPFFNLISSFPRTSPHPIHQTSCLDPPRTPLGYLSDPPWTPLWTLPWSLEQSFF